MIGLEKQSRPGLSDDRKSAIPRSFFTEIRPRDSRKSKPCLFVSTWILSLLRWTIESHDTRLRPTAEMVSGGSRDEKSWCVGAVSQSRAEGMAENTFDATYLPNNPRTTCLGTTYLQTDSLQLSSPGMAGTTQSCSPEDVLRFCCPACPVHRAN